MTENVYFVGIGGIGMSALARFFLNEGKKVGGYDRTRTKLTETLEKEGADIHYIDDTSLISEPFRNPLSTLVIYTPAIPTSHKELAFFRRKGHKVTKRSKALGSIAEGRYVMAISGTHGKTTTTTLTAWLNRAQGQDGRAFMGGISVNFGSNIHLGTQSDRLAVEADEFDRSFHTLYPDIAVVTSIDADHLDIYGTHENVRKAFEKFISQIRPSGTLIIKKGVTARIDPAQDLRIFRYSLEEECDFYARNITTSASGMLSFDIVCPDRVIEGCTLGIIGRINIENAVAATAAVWAAGNMDSERIKEGLASFKGVRRRFECYVNTPSGIFIDDYAHHPNEVAASLSSMKALWPDRRLTVIFQPHLFTRTRDFYREFADALSIADSVILLPIYPAREEPIQGVTSKLIAENVSKPVRLLKRENLLKELQTMDTDIVATLGAGDIERLCGDIAETVRNRSEHKA